MLSSISNGNILLDFDKIETVIGKIVFDEKIQDFEINESVRLAQKYDIPIILQPKMNGNEIGVSHSKIVEVFNTFTEKYKNTRLIGQVHKFFDIR